MSAVLLLCWRDTGHPQGGGSEAYLQRIGAQLAATGVDVTLRTARYPVRRAARWSMVCGSTAPGTDFGIPPALLAMAAARLGRAAATGAARRGDRYPERRAVSGAAALLAAVAVLVHHCHREQWPVAGRCSAAGLVYRVEVVAAAAPPQSVRDGVVAVGPRPCRARRGQRSNRGGAQRS
ncbi:putative glycosyltransferase [Mycobacterium xenopi 3993]|nr:putative glycosyltransferase [Mycobacterium xenopi 3993]